MTIDELQELIDRNDVAVGYLGRAGKLRTRRAFACTLQPAGSSSRWRAQEFFIRGFGETYTEAVEDALTQLSVFLVDRVDPP